MENFKIFGFHISKLIVVIFLITLSECFPNYQNRIPNSNRVPNPCTSDTSDTWAAVGHWGPNRGGPRNPFGRHFAANNRRYTYELHLADSDNDGVPNGVELGLIWNTATNRPEVNQTHNYPIGHPGICEPLTSSRCSMFVAQFRGFLQNCQAAASAGGQQQQQQQQMGGMGFPPQNPFAFGGQGPVPLNQQQFGGQQFPPQQQSMFQMGGPPPFSPFFLPPPQGPFGPQPMAMGPGQQQFQMNQGTPSLGRGQQPSLQGGNSFAQLGK